jgi:hypothetical protein
VFPFLKGNKVRGQVLSKSDGSDLWAVPIPIVVSPERCPVRKTVEIVEWRVLSFISFDELRPDVAQASFLLYKTGRRTLTCAYEQ